MAKYAEIRALFSNGGLIEQTQVACIIAANDMIAGTPTVPEKSWAAGVFSNPRSEAQKALMAVLAENKDLSVAQIEGATDAAVQTQVNVVVPILVDAAAGV